MSHLFWLLGVCICGGTGGEKEKGGGGGTGRGLGKQKSKHRISLERGKLMGHQAAEWWQS